MSISIFGEIDISERNLKEKRNQSYYPYTFQLYYIIIYNEKDKIGK